MRIAPFSVDLTPPVGFPLAYGFNQRADSPVHLRGLILDDRGLRVVLASAEFIGFYGGSSDPWRKAIAAAAGTTPARVLLHCVHQHDSLMPPSPFIMQRIATRKDSYKGEWQMWEAMRTLTADKIRMAAKNLQTVAGIGTAERRLSGLAANRRLLGPNGKVRAMRWSMTTNPALQREPVGSIDPLLRSIGFFGAENRLLATLHFYASHPMDAYGRQMASADIPGVALQQLKQSVKGNAAHIYLTGCGADVTFGKYTVANKKTNLSVLGRRLGDGLIANTHALRPKHKGQLKLHSAAADMPLNRATHTKPIWERKLAKTETRHTAFWAAANLEAVEHWQRWRRMSLYRLELAPEIQIVSFPAETPIEFQLHAQALAPDKFIACAAYRDLIYQYLCTPQMFKEGGYEPTGSVCTGDAGTRMYAALEKLLADVR